LNAEAKGQSLCRIQRTTLNIVHAVRSNAYLTNTNSIIVFFFWDKVSVKSRVVLARSHAYKININPDGKNDRLGSHPDAHWAVLMTNSKSVHATVWTMDG